MFGVRSMALNMLQEWKRSQDMGGGGHKQIAGGNHRWSKPQEGWVKINIDAACCNQLEFIGLGCIVRNDQGQFLKARSARIIGGGKLERQKHCASKKRCCGFENGGQPNVYLSLMQKLWWMRCIAMRESLFFTQLLTIV